MSRDFRQLLAEQVVVFDGAMGTRLYDLGVFLNRCFDELNLSASTMVEDVHRSYASVGVDVVETNTFGGTSGATPIICGRKASFRAMRSTGTRPARRISWR